MRSTSELLETTDFRCATGAERERIYELRHELYAGELGQYPVRPDGRLTDEVDGRNLYIVAAGREGVRGFVSITPPGSAAYRFEKYFDRGALPLALDGGVFEVRLLSVLPPWRRSPLALLLMHACLRWVQSRDGRLIVAMGRRAVLGLYTKVGLVPLGPSVRAGAVDYDLLAGRPDVLEETSMTVFGRFFRDAARSVRWQLDMPFLREAR